MTIKYVFMILFFIVLMVFIPVYSQIKFSEIDVDNFPQKIKLKKLSFLFKATGGRSAVKDGIIKPLFILQLASYFIALLTTIFDIILIISGYTFSRIFILTAFILGSQMMVIVCIMSILMLINRKRNDSNKSLEKEFTKEQVRKIVNKRRK